MSAETVLLQGLLAAVAAHAPNDERPAGGRTVVMVQPYVGVVETLLVDSEGRVTTVRRNLATHALAESVSEFATSALRRLPEASRRMATALLMVEAASVVLRVDLDSQVATLILVPARGDQAWQIDHAVVLCSLSAAPALQTH